MYKLGWEGVQAILVSFDTYSSSRACEGRVASVGEQRMLCQRQNCHWNPTALRFGGREKGGEARSLVGMRGMHRDGRDHIPWRILAGVEKELVGRIDTLCVNIREIST